MSDKYEIAQRDSRVGMSIPLGRGRVRPSYLEFLRLRDSRQLPKGTTHDAWEKANPETVRELNGATR